MLDRYFHSSDSSHILIALLQKLRPCGQTAGQATNMDEIERVFRIVPLKVDVVDNKLNIWRDPINLSLFLDKLHMVVCIPSGLDW